MKNEDGLTPKQRRFVDEYLIDLNAGAAALRAGFSARTAARQGSHLRANPRVAAEIARRQAVLRNESEVTVERILAELASIAMAPLGDRNVKASDKHAALVSYGKHLGMFVERHRVEGRLEVVGQLTDEQLERIAATALTQPGSGGAGTADAPAGEDES